MTQHIVTAFSLAIKLKGDSFWTTVTSSESLAEIETEAARYDEAGHKAQQIRVLWTDGERLLSETVTCFVEYLVWAVRYGYSLVGPGRNVRLWTRKDARLCQMISDALDEELRTTAAGRMALAPTGDLSRQYNAITQDGPA